MAPKFIARARQAADDAKTGATLSIVAVILAIVALAVAIIRR